MDDIRRPQQAPRRDYALPAQPQRAIDGLPAAQPAPQQPNPQPQFQAPQPQYQPQPPSQFQAPAPSQFQPAPQPQFQAPAPQPEPNYQAAVSQPQPYQAAYQPQPENFAQQTAANTQPIYGQPPQPYSGYTQPQPAAAPAAAPQKKRGLFGFLHRTKKTAGIVAGLAIAGGLIAGGYSLKSSGSANTLPASVTQQAKFDVFFPSPMPPGYTYMKDTATFQIGQVFYKFSSGRKRVTVREEPLNGNKPNLDLLSGYTRLSSPIGQAAIGTSVGQPTAVVVTNTTVITMNSIGGVTQDDLKAAINNFKNIGQNTDKRQ